MIHQNHESNLVVLKAKPSSKTKITRMKKQVQDISQRLFPGNVDKLSKYQEKVEPVSAASELINVGGRDGRLKKEDPTDRNAAA